jgi:proline iminopeptidase
MRRTLGSFVGRDARRAVLSQVLLCGFSLLACGCGAEDSATPSREGLQLINDTELFVKRLGNGDPIVIVHGGPLSDHGYLLPHLSALAENYELVFYDQRLSGRSAPRVDSASVRIATFVDDIEQLRVSLDLQQVHLIGHSWGGLIAMLYAIEHQQNLKSLILISSNGASSEIWREEQLIFAQRMTAEDSAERQAIRESEAFVNQKPEAIEQMLRLSYRPLFHEPSLVDQLQLYVPDDYADRSEQFRHMMVDMTEFDLHSALAGVTVPALILCGAAEPSAQLSGPMLHERFPNSTFVVIEEAGHFPFLEQPAAFMNAVRSFLERPSTGG